MANSPRKGRKRVLCDIPEELYNEMKLRTVFRNCSMTKWISRAIVNQLIREKVNEASN